MLSPGGRGKARVLLVEGSSGLAVVKDFATQPALVRATWARLVMALEARAYAKLAGHPAVPRWLDQIDRAAFALEYRPGRPLTHEVRLAVGVDFVERLEQAVRAMHERGVVHLDLAHRSNVLVDESHNPVLIDFESALWLRPGGWPHRLFFPWLARLDHRALAKWRRKWCQSAVASGPPGGDDGAGGRSASRRGASRPT